MITIRINAATAAGVPHDILDRALREAFRQAGVDRAELSVTFVDDEEISRLHGRYLGSDRPTDVISFALHAEDEDPLGDVYVGHAQALRQAAEAHIAPEEELVRLAVHGALHVLGHDHPQGTDRRNCEMFRVQEDVLRRAVSP